LPRSYASRLAVVNSEQCDASCVCMQAVSDVWGSDCQRTVADILRKVPKPLVRSTCSATGSVENGCPLHRELRATSARFGSKMHRTVGRTCTMQVVFMPSVRARTKRHIMRALRTVESTQLPRSADGAAPFHWQRRVLSWRQWRSCLLCNTGK
jgi:hypothetical protein